MNWADLKIMVSQGEGQFLEFKKKADHPEKIVRELVAFSNSGGGNLLIGVDDDGTISGLRFPEEEAYVMEAAIFHYARPALDFQWEKVKIPGGLEVLLYQIFEGKSKPYSWLADKQKQVWRVYVRSKDQSVQASKEMLRILKQEGKTQENNTIQWKGLEQKMIQFFGNHDFMTISDLVKLGKLAPWKASLKLVFWVKNGILRIEPREGGDVYFLQDAYKEKG